MTHPPDADTRQNASRRQKARLYGVKKNFQPGAVPGTLKPLSGSAATRIHVFAYNQDRISEHDATTGDDITALRGAGNVLWIDVVGLGDADLIRKLGEIFGLHRLALEDVVNVHQRPKAEEYDGHIFIVSRMPHLEDPSDSEQVSMFLGADYLLTFQERPGDCFESVRKRLRAGGNRMRSSPPDYLCYALIDSILDGYFPVLELYGERLEDLEDEVVAEPRPNHIQSLHEEKRDLLMLRRAIWPHREMLSGLIRDENDLFSDGTRVYLRDCYDHTIQLIDIVETYREIASGLIDVYISSVGAKLNEVMKVLTIIATIFIPLGFIAGLYGMNFDPEVSPWNMPELHTYYGYPGALFVMAATGAGMLYYFWRKGWIGSGPERNAARRRRGKRER